MDVYIASSLSLYLSVNILVHTLCAFVQGVSLQGWVMRSRIACSKVCMFKMLLDISYLFSTEAPPI